MLQKETGAGAPCTLGGPCTAPQTASGCLPFFLPTPHGKERSKSEAMGRKPRGAAPSSWIRAGPAVRLRPCPPRAALGWGLLLTPVVPHVCPARVVWGQVRVRRPRGCCLAAGISGRSHGWGCWRDPTQPRPVTASLWPYLYEGDDHRADEHERGVECGPQQKGGGQAARLREPVDICARQGHWRLSHWVPQPSLLGPGCHPGLQHTPEHMRASHATWKPQRHHTAQLTGSDSASRHMHRAWHFCRPGSDRTTPGGPRLCCWAPHQFCGGELQRILSLTTLYFRPAKFSTTMSMKQATRPVRIPIMAQMTQRLISTVRKACGEAR